ncbi:MAG: BlaI/MecI/CopY family transcriptional regulator [Bacteroidales bacterium]
MTQLTKAEEEIMKVLWELGAGKVKDVRNRLSDPKPARNTVSTVLRVLEKKGFVGHESLGNVYRYHPLVKQSDYSKKQLFRLMDSYFNSSFPAMASMFVRGKDLSAKELEELLEETRQELENFKKKK